MERIDYHLGKYPFSCSDEAPRLTWLWADMPEEYHWLKAVAEERLRITLLNVNYVASFGLLFRLLLPCSP